VGESREREGRRSASAVATFPSIKIDDQIAESDLMRSSEALGKPSEPSTRKSRYVEIA
jgi:hypothetical protein